MVLESFNPEDMIYGNDHFRLSIQQYNAPISLNEF